METDFANIEGIFNTNTAIVNKAIGDIGNDDWFRTPGDDSNHLLWLMGHLIVHRGMTLKAMGVDWDASWSSLFARGSERIGDAEYPSTEEIQAAWAHVSEQLSAALSKPSAAVLTQETPKGFSFDGKVSGKVAFLAFHDAYHVGQISFLRKWLGYGQTVG